MPWRIGDHPDCSKQFAVIKTDDNSLAGCHDTRQEAVAQLAALNANVSESITIYYEADIQPAGEPTGAEWNVTIIGAQSGDDLINLAGREYVRSKNGRLYDVQALSENALKFDGAKVYDNHLTQDEFEKKQGMRSVAGEWIGTIVKPVWEAGKRQITGTLKIVDQALAGKLKAAWDAGVLDTIGLSIDTFPIIGNQQVVIEGQRFPVIEGFKKILSVDLVAEPAAGGRFNRLIAATITEGETTMEPKEIKELVKKAISDMVPSVVAETLAATKEAAKDEQVEAEPEQLELPEPEPAEQHSEANPLEARLRKMEAAMLVEKKVTGARLNDKFGQLVRDTFIKPDLDEAELDKFIKSLKEAQAERDASGRVSENGHTRDIKVGQNEQDRFETEFLRLAMGTTAFKQLGSISEDFVVERVPESYRAWEKDKQIGQYRRISELVYDLLGGDPMLDERASEAVTTSSMSSIVKNAVNVMLAANYARRHRWWEPIVRTEEVDTIDQATLVRVYGLDALDVVNEGAAYTELTWADEEETPTFVKKGNFVGVTLEALLRDKLNAIRTLPERLATAWFNTLSALNSGVFTVNSDAGPVLTDTGALFNATAVSTAGGHANLLTTAFGTDTTAYEAARLAMRKQTDQTLGNGQRIGILPKYLLVPYDLEVGAQAVINSEQKPGSANNDPNPVFRESEVIGVPLWTDTNNWALVGDPMEHPAIWNIFLRGNRVPQIFTADNEVSGAMFTNDTLRYKVRMLTWRFSATYDCAPVGDFRPLHKNNVT